MYKELIDFIRELYQTNDLIPLHEPYFDDEEIKQVSETIHSTFVSTIGESVIKFEEEVKKYTGANYAVATINGTSALHIALTLSGVKENQEVVTQSLTFVATCNAIRYCGADPVFVDVEKNTLGMCPDSLCNLIEENYFIDDNGHCKNKKSGKILKACLPMHTFGLSCDIQRIKDICIKYNISLIEDAAESLGTYNDEIHTGTFSHAGILSFNGNKIITTGAGGMILINDQESAKIAKHLTTTAKITHKWKIEHDQVGYNYRLPNLNAALGLAQMKKLPDIIKIKRKIAEQYQSWGKKSGVEFIRQSKGTESNYWLNTFLADSNIERDKFLDYSYKCQVAARPVWTPMHQLPMYLNCRKTDLSNTEWLADRLINVPSSVKRHHFA